MKKEAGTTLIEFVIYIGIVAILSATSVVFLSALMRGYAVVRAEKQLSQDTAVVFERMFNEARHARLIYTPTSTFGTSASQVSFRTSLNPPTDETFTYVDYYVDNSVLYEKREGLNPIALTGANTRVTNFNVTRLTAGSAEGIRVALTVGTPLTSGPLSRSFSWTGSTTLRGY